MSDHVRGGLEGRGTKEKGRERDVTPTMMALKGGEGGLGCSNAFTDDARKEDEERVVRLALVPERLPSAASQSSCNSSSSVVDTPPPPPPFPPRPRVLLCAKYPGCPSSGTGALFSSARSLTGSDACSSESS